MYCNKTDSNKVEGKGDSITGHEGPEGCRSISLPFL
jgi:hypothetical protein